MLFSLGDTRKTLEATFHTKQDASEIDGVVAFLHYRVTASFLVIASVVIGIRQNYGDPIECSVSSEAVSQHMFEQYCWTHGTFTGKEYFTAFRDISIHPGVGFIDRMHFTRVYHTYYQYVTLVLVLDAARFYVPRFIWKYAEGGKVAWVVFGDSKKSGNSMRWNPNKHAAQMVDLHGDFETRALRAVFNHSNGTYLVWNILYDIMNAANVTLEFVLINWFIGQDFQNLGWEYLKYFNSDNFSLLFDDERHSVEAASPLEQLFPRMTMCQMRTGAPNGGVTNTDGLCLLQLNVIHEKIYLALWFWLVFLLLASAVTFAFKMVALIVPPFRTVWLMNSCSSGYGDPKTRQACFKLRKLLSVPSLLVLTQISRNVNADVFEDMVLSLSKVGKKGDAENGLGKSSRDSDKDLNTVAVKKDQLLSNRPAFVNLTSTASTGETTV